MSGYLALFVLCLVVLVAFVADGRRVYRGPIQSKPKPTEWEGIE